MLARGELLARNGYGLLLYDRRATGESDGRWRTFGWADVRDVPAAVDFALAQEGVEQVSIHGFSLGGQVALRGAAVDERIVAVVAEEPGFVCVSDVPPLSGPMDHYVAFLYWLNFRGIALRTGEPIPDGVLDSLPFIAPRPIQYLSSGPNGEVGHEFVAYYHDNTPVPSELWHVPEATHGGIPGRRTQEYERRIVNFFVDAMNLAHFPQPFPGNSPTNSLDCHHNLTSSQPFPGNSPRPGSKCLLTLYRCRTSFHYRGLNLQDME